MNSVTKSLLTCLFLLLLSSSTFYRLFRPGFFSSQDNMHLFRLEEYYQCLTDHQVPCRFSSNASLGFGSPIFNYYPPLTYQLGSLAHFLGFNFIDSIKVVFIISLLAGTFGIYLLASSFWGRTAGLISAVLFTLAPYRAVDFFVRGALPELLALGIMPWIFFFLYQKKFFKFTFSLVLLLLCHNLISLVTLPLLFLFELITSKTNLKKFFIFTSFSLIIAASFLLPALFEKRLVTVETMTQGYFQYSAHFATLRQLFLDRSWGFGASLWGPIDDMSFQIGYLHWLLPLIILILTFFFRPRTSKLFLSFFLLAIFFIFLTHNRSTFIWQIFPSMAYFQFPWRFLGPAIFLLSLSSGFVTQIVPTRFHLPALILISAVTFLLNFNYFKEDIWYSIFPRDLMAESSAGLRDYWPKSGYTYPKSLASQTPSVSPPLSATITSFSKNSHQLIAEINVSAPSSTITFPLVYFPNMKLTDNSQGLAFEPSRELGLVTTHLTTGNHRLLLRLVETPLRLVSNILSIIGTLSFLIYYFTLKSREK